MFRSVAIALLGLLLPQASYAAPPKDLYGKSVIVSWTETREQRPLGVVRWCARADGLPDFRTHALFIATRSPLIRSAGAWFS